MGEKVILRLSLFNIPIFSKLIKGYIFSRQTILNRNLVYLVELVSRKCELRKNLHLRKIVPTTKILVHKLFDFKKDFLDLMFEFTNLW